MLGIRVLRSVVKVRLDRTLRLGGAAGGVWRMEDDRRRLHDGDLVVLTTTCLTHVNTGVCVFLKREERKEPLTS